MVIKKHLDKYGMVANCSGTINNETISIFLNFLIENGFEELEKGNKYVRDGSKVIISYKSHPNKFFEKTDIFVSTNSSENKELISNFLKSMGSEQNRK